MKRAALAVAATLAVAGPLAAQQQPAQDGRVHVVRRGDTLWDLARYYLADPFLWPEIFRLNTDVVRDPARIYPNERLVLPGRVATAQGEPERTVFYESERRRDRTVVDIQSIPYSIVRQGDFYRAGYVAHEREITPVGRVAELLQSTVVPLNREPTIQVYDQVFVAMAPGARLSIGDRIQFLHPDREIPGRFGRVWLPRGVGTVSAVDGSTATVVVIRMFDPITPGDLVVPVAAFPLNETTRPGAATNGLQGKILAFQRVHPAQANEEIAFLDIGRQAGVKVGDEFEAFVPRSRRDWGTRPEMPVARMQVVKVTEGTASARITQLTQPAVSVGLPVRRVAQMP